MTSNSRARLSQWRAVKLLIDMTSLRGLLCGCAASALVGFLPGPLLAQEYHIDRSRENRVVFISRAPIDEFEGITDLIDGYAYIEGDSGLVAGADYGGSELYLEVELNGLDTGIRLRNRQMRDDYLETGRYPYATYSAAIESVDRNSGGEYTINASGTFSVHGVERPLEISCNSVAAGAGYRVRCGFEVLLSDYNIERPALMFLKLSDTIRLQLDFYLKPVDAE